MKDRAPTHRVYEILRIGSRGDQVLQVQKSLPAYTKGESFIYDGLYGIATEDAVKLYQESCGLSADGIVGEDTATALGLWVTVEAGIDISNYQTVSWGEVRGVSFAIIKASEGYTYQDPSFWAHCNGALSVGIPISAYHYTKFSNPPLLEVYNFLETTKPFDNLIEKYYLDVEESSITDNATLAEWIDTFSKTVRALKGRNSFGIYTSSRVMKELRLTNKGLNKMGELWASDRSGQPSVYPWGSWDVWQQGLKSIPGVEGQVDFNLRIKLP